MSMQQKIKDVTLLLKEDRKAQVIGACLVVAVLFLFTHEEPVRSGGKVQLYGHHQQDADQLGAQTADEVYDDLQKVVVQRLDQQSEVLEQLKTDIQDTNERIEENELRTAEIFETLIKRVETQAALPGAPGALGDPLLPVDGSIPEPDAALPEDGLEPFGEIVDTGLVAPPDAIDQENPREAYIAPTDFVRVKLLAGVNAPTDGTPYPVLFEVIGDVQSPDGGTLPLGGARLLAAAQGSLIDSRALFRVTTLTMRLPNGQLIDVQVDGWVVGEDGIRGMEGLPIDPLGKIIGTTLITGAVQGAGQALQAQNVVVTQGTGGVFSQIDGDVAEVAAGGALAQAGNQWTSILQQRMQEAVPAIQVFSGREATVIFSQGTVIPQLYEMVETGEQDIWASLD